MICGYGCILLDQVYTGNGLSASAECRNEVLPDLLRRWRTQGTRFLEELNGAFALSLHDSQSNEILISTDRFSTYPLWRCELDHAGMAISSDFTALAGLIQGTIDYASLWSFLTRGRPVGQHSFYNEIRAIRPATALLFRNGKLVEEVEWYKPKFEPEDGRSLSYWGRELAERLEAAVQDQMKGSKSPGLLLSGGLDSRLVASVSPANTICFTLADFDNREMKIASKVAKTCGLRHCPIIRSEDWYPGMLQDAARKSWGLWHWHHMHFLPLQNALGEWKQVDRVMLGMGYDTFLKGNQIAQATLWKQWHDSMRSGTTLSFLAEFGAQRLPVEQYYEAVMHPEVVATCREAYKAALVEELKSVLPMATCLPDAWEMVQFRSTHRVPYFTNLTCLRDFIPARNVIFDNRLYDLYFRIPARIRRTGNVVRAALRHRDIRLALMLDGNSWLPTLFPSGLHELSRRLRRGVSAMRNKWYRVSGSKSYKSYGSWPQVGRLWIRNELMRRFMDRVVTLPLMNLGFREETLGHLWEGYKRGTVSCSSVIDALAGLAVVRDCLRMVEPVSSVDQ